MMLSVGTERDADADVYARHAPELVRFAAVLAGPSGADDLVASAVLRAFTNPGWSGVQNQRAYLYRAVLNEARLVSNIPLDVCVHHHERVDGRGYPFGLAGHELSIHARIAAICGLKKYQVMITTTPTSIAKA